MNKLVVVVTRDADRVLKDVFIMTYRTFASSRRVLKKLIERYYVRPDSALTDAENDKRMKATQLRVCNTIKSWMETFPNDFNEKLLSTLNNFVDSQVDITLSGTLRSAIAKVSSFTRVYSAILTRLICSCID